MKFAIFVLTFMVAFTVQGQTPLQEMVKTEQTFSKMAEEKNTRDAFMEFIADDGLLFRPGAVNGKKWMQEHPVPPSDKKPLLAWQPSFAGIAASGDMGFTTGPWEFKGDIKDAQPSGYGHFVTVWKKQADGSWKFAVDLGISHPQSGGPQTPWEPTETATNTSAKTVVTKIATKGLLVRDRVMSLTGSKDGLANVFKSFASPEVRLYRNASLPFVGLDASVSALSKMKGQFISQPIGGDVSRAGDLGYTHGTYEITEGKKVVERGSYVRIWKMQDNAWRLVLDVTNAH